MQWIVAYGEETEIPISANTVEEAQKAADKLTDFREWIPSEWHSQGDDFWVKGETGGNYACLWQI
jgi:hypothetical protein